MNVIVNVELLPLQIVPPPETVAVGRGLTVIGAVVEAVQPLLSLTVSVTV